VKKRRQRLSSVRSRRYTRGKQAHVQGSVVLHAILGIDGAVKELTVVSGPTQLVKSALDAVLQWRYRPTLINGYPVEVDTTITTVFTLDETAPEAAAGAKPNGNRPLNTNEYRQQELQALAAVDPGTAADIRRLLEVTRAQTLVSQIFDSQLPLIKENLLKSLPSDPDRQALADTFIKKMHDRAASGDLVELIIPVYAKHFTHDDIKTMLAFFDSPTGRRLREESPAYLQEVQEVTTQHWQNVVVPELLKEMAAGFPEIGKRKN
jgi:hypothetical protein